MEINDNIQALDWLLSLKKKGKEPNRLERAQFSSEWAKLVEREGLSERAEYYLYNGYVFCGARPLKDYIQKSGDSATILNKMYHGKHFKANCANTSSVLCHLLTLYLNESKQDLSVIISLIQEIPIAMKNKEGCLYGQADRCLKKYLFDELRPDTKLPPFQTLYECGLNKKDALRFADVINQVMGGKNVNYENWAAKSRRNVSSINAWIQGISQANMAELSAPKQKVEKKPCPQEAKQAQDVEQSDNKSQPLLKTADSKTVSIAHEKKTEAVSATPESGVQIEQLNKELIEVKKALEEAVSVKDKALAEQIECQKKFQLLQRELTQSRETLHAAESKTAELSQALAFQTKRNEELEKALTTYRDEAEKALEMVEILRRDKDKQSDETVKRIASRLRTYYMDYEDAISLEMSTDLGENMRDQLGEVFKILQDAGIIMK